MKILLAMALLLVGLTVKAQDEDARTFSVDAQVGGTLSPHVRSLSKGPFAMPEKVKGGSGLLTKLRVEYYLPYLPLSIKAGYEHEEWNFLDTNFGDDMALFSLGMRCYPGQKTWGVQPYVGLDGLYNLKGGRYAFNIDRNTDRYGHVRYDGMANIPRFNLAPIVGVDLYLFSCIAIQLEYGCRMGLGKASVVQAKYAHIEQPFEMRLRPIRHSFNIGLKVAFPFHFTDKDGQKMIDGLLDDWLFNLLFGPREDKR